MLPLLSCDRVPNENIALKQRPAASLQISLLSKVLPSFPFPVGAVEKKIIPLEAFFSEPFTKQYLIVLFSAEPINCIVEVPATAEILVLLIVNDFVVPVAFSLPSMVTLSAPFSFIRAVAKFPLIERPVAVG